VLREELRACQGLSSLHHALDRSRRSSLASTCIPLGQAVAAAVPRTAPARLSASILVHVSVALRLAPLSHGAWAGSSCLKAAAPPSSGGDVMATPHRHSAWRCPERACRARSRKTFAAAKCARPSACPRSRSLGRRSGRSSPRRGTRSILRGMCAHSLLLLRGYRERARRARAPAVRSSRPNSRTPLRAAMHFFARGKARRQLHQGSPCSPHAPHAPHAHCSRPAQFRISSSRVADGHPLRALPDPCSGSQAAQPGPNPSARPGDRASPIRGARGRARRSIVHAPEA
jgi:hypothetical protein